MFVFLLTYTKPLEEVDRWIEAHRLFLTKYFAAGKFVCAGRQKPAVGGVILCTAGSRGEAEAIAAEDPFKKEGVAEYEIIEFTPSRVADGLEMLAG